jgi:hypothetical protein
VNNAICNLGFQNQQGFHPNVQYPIL